MVCLKMAFSLYGYVCGTTVAGTLGANDMRNDGRFEEMQGDILTKTPIVTNSMQRAEG